jgi:hypothetical protein
MRATRAVFLLVCLGLQAKAVLACHNLSPLVLDLNGDGIQTTDLFAPVSFDLDGDGEAERVAWTYGWSEEGFLWIDLNRNAVVDSGRELFGQGTLLPSGDTAENGFEALGVYDDPSYGGNADDLISEKDLAWGLLRLWVDRNHDGLSQEGETAPPGRYGVVAISLDYSRAEEFDGNGNLHLFQATYLKRLQGRQLGSRLVPYAVHDVFFRIGHDD